ncbi:hypothetical protein BHE74_00037306 [Ensete ventricosum]|nr:hypothetical protein BHE74_00037306 [Ensete ventricosum]RZS18112.1 hypothetical protein BHM03_00050337 [Ensete ventricosum]
MTEAMELQPDDGPKSSLNIGPGFGRCSGISSKFARRFIEGIGKVAGNTLKDRQKKTGRLTARMSEAAGLVGLCLDYLDWSLLSGRYTVAAQAGRVNHPYLRIWYCR